MSEENKNELKQSMPIAKWFFIIVAFVVAAILFFIPNYFQKEKHNETNLFSQATKICELATLRCYYHDVAEGTVQPGGLFQYGLFRFGYKKYWIEYDGIVELGIDGGNVIINPPDNDGTVKVYVPKARVLNIDMDVDSMKDVVWETGAFTKITVEDQAQAYSQTQANMKEKAGADDGLLSEARENAKKLLEKYIIGVGDQMGTQYKIIWVDDTTNDTQPISSGTLEGKQA